LPKKIHQCRSEFRFRLDVGNMRRVNLDMPRTGNELRHPAAINTRNWRESADSCASRIDKLVPIEFDRTSAGAPAAAGAGPSRR
jgi:hypothetical protein